MIGTIATAAPAAAHATVESTQPAQGERLPVAPPAVTVTFSTDVAARLSEVRVTDPRGRRVDLGPVTHPAARPEVLSVRIRSGLPTGSYLVTFSTVSADSHTVTGSFAFSVGAGPSLTAAGAVSDDTGGDPVVGVLVAVTRWGGFVGLALMTGLVLVAVTGGQGLDGARVRWLVVTGCGLSAAAAVAAFLLHGPHSTGEGLAGALSQDFLAATWGTPYGRLLALRVVAVAGFAIVALKILRGHDVPEPVRFRHENIAMGAGLAIAVSFAGTGHAASDSVPLVSLLGTLAHLTAMAVWLGGLAVLGVALLPSAAHRDAVRPVRTFSTIAAWCIGVLVGTGGCLAWRSLGSAEALWSTSYGRLLTVKLLLVAAVLVVAQGARRTVRRHWLPAPATADPAIPRPGGGTLQTVGSITAPARPAPMGALRRAVAAELLIALVVLAVTAVLLSRPPAATKPQAGAPGTCCETLSVR